MKRIWFRTKITHSRSFGCWQYFVWILFLFLHFVYCNIEFCIVLITFHRLAKFINISRHKIYSCIFLLCESHNSIPIIIKMVTMIFDYSFLYFLLVTHLTHHIMYRFTYRLLTSICCRFSTGRGNMFCENSRKEIYVEESRFWLIRAITCLPP